MRKSNHAQVRALLRAHPDGLTFKEMKRATGKTDCSLRRTIKAMPDVYRDRWVLSEGKKMMAVYIAVTVPEDCPYPTKKPEI